MNTRAFLLGCLMAGAAMLTACQVDEYTIPWNPITPVNPTDSVIPSDSTLITEVPRVVLVEDFTGQKCVNCPNATLVLHGILEAYGEQNIIPVAIHCGPFGLSTATGLVTEAGKTYWSAFFSDTQGQPVAKINRGAANTDYLNWSLPIAKEMARPTNVTLKAEAQYLEEGRGVELSIEALGKAEEVQKLQLWLVEDSIVAIQALPTGGSDRQYVHNHVLREALNGDWGESITFGEEAVKVQKTFTLDEKYKAEHTYVVAFTYDDSGVTQATRTKVLAPKN